MKNSNSQTNLIKISWYQSILFKIVIMSWMLVIITLFIFILSYIPYHKRVSLNNMESEAQNIASSIGQVSSNAIILEDYSFAIDHCLKVVNESKTLQYVIVTKNNGFSLIHTRDGWQTDTLDGYWSHKESIINNGTILNSDILQKKVFHYSYKFNFSGYEWGWIHIGLSLKNYDANMKKFYYRMFLIFILCSILGLFLAIFVGKGIAKPIKQLDCYTKEISKGKRIQNVNIKTGDEIESLANSFKTMTTILHSIQDNLEQNVIDRTRQLSISNDQLEKEIKVRKNVEELIKASLTEKEILLKEIHHRVKNNLQIINSLLYLQSKRITDPHFLAIFKDSQSRIKTMALIHEKLYRTDNLAFINFSDYIKSLTSYLYETYITNGKKVEIIRDITIEYFNIDIAIPCGLIINELVTNSLKHAFTNREHGSILIEVKNLNIENDKEYYIKISDNGHGMNQEININNVESLGLKLIYNLTRQLEGELTIHNENGAVFEIRFNG